MAHVKSSLVERYEIPHFTTFATSGEVTKWALKASPEEIETELTRMHAWSEDFPRYAQLKRIITEVALIKSH
jgi:hypothetical protein